MKTTFIVSDSFDPYLNLALEEYLISTVDDDTVILYLWQNQNTVVIGKNQNCWSECKVHELESEGGYLARRLSGGGAVFHDLGNLNFTFIADKKHYDVDRQLAVILKAVQSLGIPAVKSGRNDITVDDRKFSGNAFFTKGGKSCHHGTILVQADMEKLGHYLTVSEAKLKSKGIKSVKARVANLTNYMPELTIAMMKTKLIKAFGEEYGSLPKRIFKKEIDPKQVESLYAKYASDSWKYGKLMDCTLEISGQYLWGGITLKFEAKNGIVEEVLAFSDAMDAEFITELPSKLRGIEFSAESLSETLKNLYDDGNISHGNDENNENGEKRRILKDIQELIRREGF